jgi:hypothetical protein
MSMRSELSRRKKMGERGEPWGTPCSGKIGEEKKPGKHQLVDLSEQKEEVNLTGHWGIHLSLKLWRSRTGTTLSKAPVISRAG